MMNSTPFGCLCRYAGVQLIKLPFTTTSYRSLERRGYNSRLFGRPYKMGIIIAKQFPFIMSWSSPVPMSSTEGYKYFLLPVTVHGFPLSMWAGHVPVVLHIRLLLVSRDAGVRVAGRCMAGAWG
jgi:hypothetical protein